ncbi:MAG: GlsB/YeaQ/YmgE family stress response membrane protein [Dehalococcoidia bacterium]
MSILAWIVVGLIAGAIAKMLMPGDDPGGIILTILLGVAGAIVGGFVAVALNISNGIDDFDIGTIVLAILGSMLILFGYRMVAGQRSTF